MSLTMLWSGKPLTQQPPIELTIKRTPRGVCLACLGDEGELVTLAPMDDAAPHCFYPSAYAARIVASRYAAQWHEQGLDVNYRSDLECGV